MKSEREISCIERESPWSKIAWKWDLRKFLLIYSFIPPEDYKPLKKFKKIYLTEQAINDSKANYIGKIIGPQGQTQKIIEKRSGCRIAVRGRGANKKQKDIF